MTMKWDPSHFKFKYVVCHGVNIDTVISMNTAVNQCISPTIPLPETSLYPTTHSTSKINRQHQKNEINH